MALPPEPIEEVLPKAKTVLEAEVAEVVSTGPTPPKIETKRGATSVGHKVASQVVKLKVTKVHRGAASVKEIVVEKPVAGYALKAGNKGAFLLDDSQPRPVILGRYGPDTWSVGWVEKALASK